MQRSGGDRLRQWSLYRYVIAETARLKERLGSQVCSLIICRAHLGDTSLNRVQGGLLATDHSFELAVPQVALQSGQEISGDSAAGCLVKDASVRHSVECSCYVDSKHVDRATKTGRFAPFGMQLGEEIRCSQPASEAELVLREDLLPF